MKSHIDAEDRRAEKIANEQRVQRWPARRAFPGNEVNDATFSPTEATKIKEVNHEAYRLTPEEVNARNDKGETILYLIANLDTRNLNDSVGGIPEDNEKRI